MSTVCVEDGEKIVIINKMLCWMQFHGMKWSLNMLKTNHYKNYAYFLKILIKMM